MLLFNDCKQATNGNLTKNHFVSSVALEIMIRGSLVIVVVVAKSAKCPIQASAMTMFELPRFASHVSFPNIGRLKFLAISSLFLAFQFSSPGPQHFTVPRSP